MTTKANERAWIGKDIKRREDPSLLMGHATYVNDFTVTGMLHAAVLRSPYAHARIVNIDVGLNPGSGGKRVSCECDASCNHAISGEMDWHIARSESMLGERYSRGKPRFPCVLIVETQIRDLFTLLAGQEQEKQLQRVAIGTHGVSAGASGGLQIVDEEVLCQGEGVGGDTASRKTRSQTPCPSFSPRCSNLVSGR